MSNEVAKISQGVYRNPQLPFLEVRTTHSSRQPYAPHLHDTLSLGVVFSGETLLTCGGAHTRLTAGDMVLIAPEEVHSCNPVDGGPRSYHMFHINAHWALSRLGHPGGTFPEVKTRIAKDRRAFAALLALADAVREGRHDDKGLAALQKIIAANCSARSTACPVPPAIAHSREILGQPDPGGDIGVAELASRTGLARETLIRSFRRVTGTTPGGYRQCLRLARALALLRRGVDIAAAAADCGYADQSHLHRMCVKYLSATPAQLRPKTSLSYKK